MRTNNTPNTLCLAVKPADFLGMPSLADLRQACRLDDLMASLVIKIRGFGKRLGRKFIRFLKSEGPLQDDP